MLGSRKFLIFGIALVVVISLFSLCLSAEEVVREDPAIFDEERVVLRSPQDPEYTLSLDGARAFGTWMFNEGYTSVSNSFVPPADLYYYESGSLVGTVSYIYISGGTYIGVSGVEYVFVGSRSSLRFDSVELYEFFTTEVGLTESDFVYRDAPSTIFAFALSCLTAILGIGSQLISFVVARPIVLIPIVAMVLVIGIGVIRRLVKGV